METVPVLQKIPWDDAKRTRERIFNAYLPNMLNSDSKAEAELEPHNDEGLTKKLKTKDSKDSKGKGKGDKEAAEGQEADEEEQQPTTVVQLWSLNNFAEDGDSELVMMDDSYDAFPTDQWAGRNLPQHSPKQAANYGVECLQPTPTLW